MGRRIRASRPSPAIIVGIVALIAALAGTAVAGPEPLAGSAASAKKTAKKALKLAKRNQQAIENIALTPGPPGEAGPQGQPATRLWAVVNADTTTPAIRRRSGAVGLQRRSAGVYDVRFNRSVRDCAPSAVVAENLGLGELDRSITAFTNGDSPGNLDNDEVLVGVSADGSTGEDTDFSVQVFC